MKKIARRDFMKGAAALTTLTILKPSIAFGYKNNSTVRMGFIGCGGRGTGVISSMSAYANANIYALADLFEDKLIKARETLNQCNAKNGFSNISKENIYQGSKAYLRLLENKNVDAVLISTPAYAHPEFLEAAVAADKHVYCEKPAAIDVDGCKQILKVSETINNKLSAVVGFQIRYATPYVEMVKRIQRGDVGELISAQIYYFSCLATLFPHDGMTFDEARIRNHFYFNELSGGILLDQGIHMIDVCNWALQGNPLQATGYGGKKGRGEFGNTWTNYQVIYKYPNDVNVSFQCTQIGPNFGDVCARFIGTKGIAEAHYSGGVLIRGESEWCAGVDNTDGKLTPGKIAAGASLSSLDDADTNKVKAFISSIETGNYINQLRSGCNSTLTAILGREAAIRQEFVTWDEIDSSSGKIDPRLNLTQFDKK